MSPQRDHELGAALRALLVPEYEPGFKADLRERLDAEALAQVALEARLVLGHGQRSQRGAELVIALRTHRWSS